MRSRRLTSFGLVVALAVSFTVCDSVQLGASRASVLSAFAYLASFQMERPEQKAPCDLTFWRLAEDSGMSRHMVAGGSAWMGGEMGFHYGSRAARPWQKLFGCNLNAFESPRAPPREVPI